RGQCRSYRRSCHGIYSWLPDSRRGTLNAQWREPLEHACGPLGCHHRRIFRVNGAATQCLSSLTPSVTEIIIPTSAVKTHTKNDRANVPPVRTLIPHIWEFIKPRSRLLTIGFALMAVNRAAGLVLPSSSKYLIDNVITKGQLQLLVPIILAVVLATAVQGVTSF